MYESRNGRNAQKNEWMKVRWKEWRNKWVKNERNKLNEWM